MSQIPIRDHETDSYQILSSFSNSFSQTERAIVQSLVDASLNMNIIGNVYTSPANDSSWNYVDISANYVDTCAIFNYPAGTVTENSVIYVDLLNNDASFNSYATNISSLNCLNNTYTFSNDSTSAPYYDCNYVVTQSINATCNDASSAVLFTFDVDASNIKIQYAMQSRWNTTTGPYTDGLNTVGPDPLAVTQDVSFNTLEAFGQKGTGVDPSGSDYIGYWASVNSTDGSIVWNEINNEDQLSYYHLNVKNRDMTGVTLNINNDIGIFRLQKGTPIVETTISNAGGTIASRIKNIPLFNGYGYGENPIPINASKDVSVNLVPGDMSLLQFQSLVNENVFGTVRDDWTFTIDISSNGGGYAFSDDPSTIVGVSQLDNSNLLDNLYYMENYVTNDHYMNIYSGDVSISQGTNGSVVTAGLIDIDLTNGEVLDNTMAGVNGQIILNTNFPSTRYTDASSVNISGAQPNPNVYYSNESFFAINLEDQENPYFRVEWQKIAQETEFSPASDYLVRNNNAILTLYTDRVVDSSYNVSNFDLSFNEAVVDQSKINLWRLDIANNIIINPQSFYTNTSYTIPVQGISTFGNLGTLTEGLTYNNYRIQLTAKTLSNLSLYNAVSSVSGWTINYSSGSYLTSSSDNAFGTTGNFPTYSSPIIQFLNNGNDLSFNYTYRTFVEANRPGGLVDFVDISFNAANPSSDPDGNFTQTIKIPQQEITRTYTPGTTTITPIADASYSFLSGTFNKQQWQLVYVVANSSYNASFSANLVLSIISLLV